MSREPEAPGEIRTGLGWDVHRLAAGRPLILGGVPVPSEAGLEGHSDADVLAHAITDAILGAADDSQDFAELVLELWLSHDEASLREKAFDELAERLVAGKKHHLETKQLEDALFQREFEV